MTSVKVAVRVRPLNQRENDLQCKFIIRMEDNKTTITNLKLPETSAEGDQGRDLIRYRQFTYDFSFWTVQKTEPDYASQQQVFECLGRDVVTSAYDGYNACVFAYGQTGSGKTYTMMGNPGDLGLIPRICRDLFAKMVDEDTSYRAEVSYLEIYNEKVRDLLKPSPSNKPMHSLRVREHPKYGPYVQDLSKHLVNDYSDIENLMNRGNAIRTTAATNMNDTSSRSHAIFTIIFTQAKFNEDMPCETSSKIHLVDLAGSERADASGATGQRLKEGGSINKSLVTLGSVISVLADISEKENKGSRTPFIPYRDSVLTWLLKDSLGGNARTIMVATISPADVNYAETLSTLRYANRAKNIINRPTVNEDPNVKLIRELREEISRLKTLLGGNIDNISSPKVQEKLHENEARVKVLTQEWAGKWNETETILQNQPVALRKEGLGVVLDSALPHLIGIDDDILSTGIMLYHLKEGTTTVGRTDSEDTTDIVIAGIDVEENHCVIENHRGEVTLYPEQGALCAVNGVAVTDPVKLTQGAVILLGKTNMFRFNHPAEAAKMKEELKSCGLCLSRTSLLSQSMSDLYKSSENLSLLAAGFEAEQAHREDLEKLEDKRFLQTCYVRKMKKHQIDLLEKKHRKAEKERNKLQVTIETELEEKQERLDMLQKQIDEEINVSEKLKLLEERERHVTDMAETQTTRLEQESERIKSDYERQKSEVQTLTTQQTELEEKISAAEADVTSQVATLLTGKSQAEDIIERETENLEKLETMLESRRRQVILNSSDIREKLARLDDEEQEYIAQCEAEEVSMKTAWNPTLFDIEDKNQKIEEAWRDIQEHERGLKFKSQKISVMSEADKEKLENEKHELAMARTLLKEEEERVSRQQQEVLDKIEKEMDEWEKRKRGKLKEIEKQKNDVVILSDKDLIDLQQKIDSKIVLIEETKLGIQHRDSELHQLDKKLNETTSSLTHELDKVKTEKGNVMRVMSQEEEVCQALTEISNQIIQVDREYQLQMSDIRSEKQRLLQLKESIDNSCLDGEVLSEDEILQRKMKEVEDLKQQLDNAQQVFEEKQKKFEEERNAEMDRIEYEMLKLQEMERQERINALVEQEVKRRMFEEKLQRENRRKVEREQEQSERAEEIQKIKDQHNRELRQLKAKLDKINNGVPAKSLMPSKSNPYVTVMTPDAPKNEENVSNRQRTGSSPLSGSLILSTDVQALNILIPSYRRQGYGSDTHYEYEVKISIGSEAWTIFRRYSKFRQLHQEWRNRIPEVNSLVFPGKKLFSKSEKVVIERQNKLQTYLRNFISVCMRNTCCVLHPSNNKYITKQVLCRFDTFFKRGLFEASKHNAT